jgi:predicted NAD/FAD-binding protein
LRIAIVGAGIAGLGAAWALHPRHRITLFEAEPRLGGHSHTVEVEQAGARIAVDTGFIVYNERNYPLLTRLLAHLGVATKPSCMSFAASLGNGAIEYSGSSLAVMLAQRRNVARPAFLRMLIDILRFNRAGRRYLADGGAEITLGELLDRGRYGRAFRNWYLLPMAAAIWSAPLAQILRFPARSFLTFFDNHGLLSIDDRPQWRTVVGGSRTYVARLAAGFRDRVRAAEPVLAVRREAGGVALQTTRGVELCDQAVLACHSDQALALLADATPAERRALEAIPYQPNRAVLHADPSLMPRRRAVWSSWNYMATGTQDASARVSVTYWMNRLQGLDESSPLFVSLNPLREPAPALTFGAWRYDHPLLDSGALAAQRAIGALQGRDRVWFAGAWLGYGFHEDGLRSGLEVARRLGAPPLWEAPAATGFPGLPERAAAGPA